MGAEHASFATGDATDVAPSVPSTAARVIAFVAILVGGALGGFIGYAVTDLQCRGDCATNKGLGMLIGAVFVALGVAVVAQLALRASSGWRSVTPTR